MLKLRFSEKQAKFSEILYLNSMFIIPISIVMGQIDFIGNYFLILGILCVLDNKLIKASMLFSLSYCFKPFSLFIIVPIMCILFYRIRKDLFIHGFIFLFPYWIQMLCTYLLIDDYYSFSSEVNMYYDFASRIIKNSYFFIMGLVCLLFLYKSKKICFSINKILTFPLIVFSLFTLQLIHHQWEIYEVCSFIVLIMLLFRFNECLGILGYLFINILQIIKLFSFVNTAYTASCWKHGFLSRYITFDKNYNLSGILSTYFMQFKLLYAMLICFLVLFVASKWVNLRLFLNKEKVQSFNYKLMVGMSLIPQVCYFTMSYFFK
ncbi:MAG: hypothetical protein ACOX3T_01035 [Bdellovibrionota bacterium]